MNFLFLCTGNSCRSIMAEALFKSLAPAGFTAESAGSKPAGYIHPRALQTLEKAGITNTGFSSKSWNDITAKPDVVITLCSDAAEEPCPVYLGNVIRSHWGMPDPAKAQGDDTAVETAFLETLTVLRRRIGMLINRLTSDPGMDAKQLQTTLDSIASR